MFYDVTKPSRERQADCSVVANMIEIGETTTRLPVKLVADCEDLRVFDSHAVSLRSSFKHLK